jgi:hypothetical protein
MVESTIS